MSTHVRSSIYPTEEINYQVELEGWLPCLDNMDKLQQYLGLSDKKPIPDPIKFEKPDPLGAKQVTGQKEEDLASTLSTLNKLLFPGHIRKISHPSTPTPSPNNNNNFCFLRIRFFSLFMSAYQAKCILMHFA